MATFGSFTTSVLKDRLTKMVQFVPTIPNGSTESMKAVLTHVVSRYGMPEEIISDREARFISACWSEPTTMSGITLCMTTAHHLQLDGQTERISCILEDMLRRYFAPTHDD